VAETSLTPTTVILALDARTQLSKRKCTWIRSSGPMGPRVKPGDDGAWGWSFAPTWTLTSRPYLFASISAFSVSSSLASSSVSGVRTGPAEWPTKVAPALIMETA